jgi:hypothetical protein
MKNNIEFVVAIDDLEEERDGAGDLSVSKLVSSEAPPNAGGYNVQISLPE